MGTSGHLLSVWVACGLIRLSWVALEIDVQQTDFRSFYDISDRPNLNPPPFAFLTGPFTYLPLPVAFWAWTALGLVSVIASLHALKLTHSQALFLIGAIGMLEPSFGNLSEGQVGWVLTYPMTQAFLNRDRAWLAGIWLGLVVAVKPTLAVFVLCLPLRYWPVTGLVAAFVSLLSLSVLGPQAWIDWWSRTQAVTWLANPFSGSLWSVAARWHLPSWELVTCAALALSVTAWRANGARRWALATIAPVLLSPLGWSYYWLLGLGPLAYTFRWSWPWIVTITVWLLPWSIAQGWVLTVPALALWWDLARRRPVALAVEQSQAPSLRTNGERGRV